ncbi:hypothetical protein H0H93_009418 [Arthromyces matolae]|nr:hypothetical protein H0H93_009418 [Arthromyces matolae]
MIRFLIGCSLVLLDSTFDTCRKAVASDDDNINQPRTWPAIWTVGANWPNKVSMQGEIDILEGVNDQGPNTATLHTNAGCTMPASRSETGIPTGNNCNAATNNNAGCGVQMSDSRSYGPSFNVNGGGWYAVERTTSYIKIWFWSRSASNIPSDVMNGDTSVNTGNWVRRSRTLKYLHWSNPFYTIGYSVSLFPKHVVPYRK